jgi:polyhydroxybutyrate depolymerase
MHRLARDVRSFGLLFTLAALPSACGSDDVPGGAATSGSAGQSNAGATTQGGSGGSNAGGAVSAGNTSAGSGTNGGSAGTAGGGSGNGGSAGSGAGAGNGGSSGSGGAAQGTPSAGCDTPAGQALGSWVEQPKLNVSGTDRQWWVWLPTGYDPAQAYPVIFTFHGCGGPDNIVPMQGVAGDKAILVRATGISNTNCWDQGPGGTDVKFFDQMLADVLAKRCADSSRVFATGYSSGSWLVNSLECVRGDKLRATGTVAGGKQFGDDTACVGRVARIFVHDSDDQDNPISSGNDDERDRLIALNHCMNTAPLPEEPAPCARYQGCDPGFPVIWCQTEGKQHARQDSFAPGAFWKLFSAL